MSETGRLWSAVLFVFALLPAGAQALDEQCPEGAVNTITGNYLSSVTTVQAADLAVKCEICLFVRVQTGEFAWEDVGRVCGIWDDADAYAVMHRIGRCGLIVPSFETAGAYYGASVPIRVEAVRDCVRDSAVK